MRPIHLILLLTCTTLLSCLDQKSTTSSTDSSVSTETIDDGNQYLKSQFYIANLTGVKITKEQAANENEILICENRSGFCQSICVNQLWLSSAFKRYTILWSGYQHPGTCAVNIFGVNSEDGTPDYYYFSGTYIQPNGSVLGHCGGISAANPTLMGKYRFTETRVPNGETTPDPFGRRLYYTLDTQLSTGATVRTYLRTYEPVQDSSAVHKFSYMIGNVETTLQSVNGFTCVRRNQITDQVFGALQ